MKYDFETIIDRHDRDALAIDEIGNGFAPDKPKDGFDIIPMWIADMNFPTAPSVCRAMRERLDDYRNIDALAMVVVKRLSLNILRHDKRHPATTLDERITVSEESSSEERYTELLRAIDTLPSKQQMILRLKHMEGMEVEEIADLGKMSHDAIYQNLSRARRAILEQFKNRKDG